MLKRLALCLCATLAIYAVIAAAQDELPNFVKIQGVLLDGTGNPVTTPVTIRISFYGDSLDVIPAFADTAMGVVPDNQGRFSCDGVYPVGYKGSTTGKPPTVIGIGVGSDPEMTPRIPIASVPFSALAQGVYGDIHTGPGELGVWDPGDGSFGGDTFCIAGQGGEGTLSLIDGNEKRTTLTPGSYQVVHFSGDTTTNIDSDGNARFAGDVQSGSSLTLQGNQYRLITSNGKIYLGRSPGTFSDVQVGIGTTSPSATLHVEGTTYLNGVTTIPSGQRIQAAASGGTRILGEQGNTAAKPAIGFFGTNGVDDGGGGNGIYRPSANAMAFAVQSTEWMRITGWGVGIGAPPVTTPASALDVNGPISTAIATVTGSVTMLSTASVTLANNSGGAISITLPVANTGKGRQVTVKKISTLANGAVNVQRQGTDLIDGATTYSLVNQYDFVVLVSDGVSNWYVVGK